jgi:hypothetical protein
MLNLVALVTGWGLPAKLAKPLLIGAGVLLLIIAVFAAVKIHDHRIISNHDANQRAATTIADRKADDNAAVQRRTDDARLTNESTELNRSTDHASTDLDRRLAFQRCLRLQQSARAAKRQPPACG